MSVAIEKIDGIDSVTVSFKQGIADIKLKPDNKVTVEQIQKSIQGCGFTSRGTDVKIRGKVGERDGKPALDVTGIDLVYLLDDHPDAKEKIGELQKVAMTKEVIVYGHLPAKEAKEEKSQDPRALQLRDFALESK